MSHPKIDKKHAAAARRAKRADRPNSTKYAKANVHGELRPGHWKPVELTANKE